MQYYKFYQKFKKRIFTITERKSFLVKYQLGRVKVSINVMLNIHMELQDSYILILDNSNPLL